MPSQTPLKSMNTRYTEAFGQNKSASFSFYSEIITFPIQAIKFALLTFLKENHTFLISLFYSNVFAIFWVLTNNF